LLLAHVRQVSAVGAAGTPASPPSGSIAASPASAGSASPASGSTPASVAALHGAGVVVVPPSVQLAAQSVAQPLAHVRASLQAVNAR
jgi:hypothetical protein